MDISTAVNLLQKVRQDCGFLDSQLCEQDFIDMRHVIFAAADGFIKEFVTKEQLGSSELTTWDVLRLESFLRISNKHKKKISNIKTEFYERMLCS